MLEEVTRKVAPPRALFVDTPLGYPLGKPGNVNLQNKIMQSALNLLYSQGPLPLLSVFPFNGQ